ncbi:MAG: cation:proton antiporter [Cyanophyceae cyanobacterium]
MTATFLDFNHSPLGAIIGPITDPVLIFLIIMAIMLVIPLIFERFKMPGIIGLILAGLVVGPYGLGMLERDDTIVLLGTVGLLFLMFLAGLETSIEDLKLNADKASIFGALTFALPMLIGTGAMMALDYEFLPAVLVASCFASHTLIALPIATKLGIVRLQAVTATLGATLITNIIALLVLVVVVRAHQGDLTLAFWLRLIPSITVFTVATLVGVPRLGKWFFRQFGHDEGAEFTFVMATLFVVAYGANLAGIEPVVGAFLAGTAITPIIPQLSPLMNRLQFIGNNLFIPFFLISVGMLIDPGILFGDARSLLVAAVMIVAEVISKFLAAWGSARIFGWRKSSMMVMFGMSVAQAAATLAAITVGFDVGLVDELTVNGTIAMILFTCVLSPWITSRWGQQVDMGTAKTSTPEPAKTTWGDRVLVPVANPNTEDNLLRLALLLTKSSNGILLPLHVLSDRNGPIAIGDQIRQQELLAVAANVAHAAVSQVQTIPRVAESIEKGILRAATEQQVSLVILGWKGFSSYQENFFGSVTDTVIRQARVPILISRLSQPIQNVTRVVLAVEALEMDPAILRETVLLSKLLAGELKADPLLLLVQTKAESTSPRLHLEAVDIPIQDGAGDLVATVNETLRPNDLLVLIPGTGAEKFGQSTLGREPETIARAHPDVSIIVVHFPR